jgi:hypothetical protein
MSCMVNGGRPSSDTALRWLSWVSAVMQAKERDSSRDESPPGGLRVTDPRRRPRTVTMAYGPGDRG